MMMSITTVFLLALLGTCTPLVSALSTRSSGATSIDRRGWIKNAAGGSAAVAAISSFGLPTAAQAASTPTITKLTDFNDPQHGFSIKVPEDWTASKQELPDRRKMCLWTDPTDPSSLVFIAYTPVRDDFTSLGSFGSVDQVAAQTILPKGELMGGEAANVDSKMLSATAAKNAYFFDYRQSMPPKLPMTHFRTIFTLQQGATGGAGAVLVTVTAQTPEKSYDALRPMFDEIINSYGKSA